MSPETLIRGFFALLLSFLLPFYLYLDARREAAPELTDTLRRYRPNRYTGYLPVFFLIVAVLFPLFMDRQAAIRSLLSILVTISIQITVLYLFLLLLLPLLRRAIDARCCAALWLLPNVLYILCYRFMALPRPLFTLRISGQTIRFACLTWLVGFCAVLAWKILSHLCFRRRILRESAPVQDPQVLELWHQEQKKAGIDRPRYRLVISPEVRTPLTIGLFAPFVRVVLPEQSYTSHDLSLIFRHELVHIGRQDCWNKFSLVFCTAMCWFNPLMWIAMRRSADDLELSCDETVLLNATPETRQSYARLLLRTAGDQRGFTTCLSASARALRYRLRGVVHPPRSSRLSWAIMGVILFALIMTSGYVSLAYDRNTGSTCIFDSREPETWPVSQTSLKIEGSYNPYECADPDALSRYLDALSFESYTGNYSFSGDQNALSVSYRTNAGDRSIRLSENTLTVWAFSQGKQRQVKYRTASEVDWTYLDTLFTAQPPVLPELVVHFSRGGVGDGGWWSPVTAQVLSHTVEGIPQALPKTMGGGSGTLSGHDVSQAQLCFLEPGATTEDALEGTRSLPPVSYTVQISDWDHTQSRTLSGEALETPYILPLEPYSAHYTVEATVEYGSALYEMRYYFDIDLPEE